ncbi:Uncharacterised protein [uncultured archaeon]|nr:Uncharacterised protein [uncultured archaeon]
MEFSQSKLIKIISSVVISTSLATIPGCIRSPDNTETIESRVKEEVKKYTKSPLENKEVYEIEPGRYNVSFENNTSCSVPFKELDLRVGKIYLRRTDSENQFKTPLKISKDYLNKYQLQIGEYEVWVENKGFYAPIEEVSSEEEMKKQPSFKCYKENGKLMFYQRTEEKVPVVIPSPQTFETPLAPLEPAVPSAPEPARPK